MASYIYLPVPTPEILKRAVALETKLNEQVAGSCHGTRRNNALKGLAKRANRRHGQGCLAGIGAGDTVYVIIHGSGTTAMERVGADRNAESEAIERKDSLKRSLLLANEAAYAGPAAENKTYTAKHLARTMQKEGLPTSHQLIELLVCGAGFSDSPAHRAQELQALEQDLQTYHEPEVASALPQHQNALRARVADRVATIKAQATVRHQKLDARPNLKTSFGERFYDALVALGYAGIRVHAYRGDVKPGMETAVNGQAAKAFTVISSHIAGAQGHYHPDHAGIRVAYGHAH